MIIIHKVLLKSYVNRLKNIRNEISELENMQSMPVKVPDYKIGVDNVDELVDFLTLVLTGEISSSECEKYSYSFDFLKQLGEYFIKCSEYLLSHNQEVINCKLTMLRGQEKLLTDKILSSEYGI